MPALQRKKYGTAEAPVDLYAMVQQYLTNLMDEHVPVRRAGSAGLPPRARRGP